MAERRPHSESVFWAAARAGWRQLAGNFDRAGFSIEWHDWHASRPLDWSQSFHQSSIEICLNLEGAGWVETADRRIEFGPETAGFYGADGVVAGERLGGQRHRFLCLEFSLSFLRSRLAPHFPGLHPLVRESLESPVAQPPPPAVAALTRGQKALITTLLDPPVTLHAQQVWYEGKALELAAELFYSGDDAPLPITRAQRVSGERVARAKAILSDNLAAPPSLEILGRQVGCSPFYLSRTFSRATGLTISQWLRRARLERAAALLVSGKWNVTEAALEVGYSSLSHFSQAFHEMFGCCPGLYPLRTPAQERAQAGQARPPGHLAEATRPARYSSK